MVKRRSIEKGSEVQLDVRLDGVEIATLVLGSESGHPLSHPDLSRGALVEAFCIRACLLAALCFGHIAADQTFDAIDEFFQQLAEEEIERKEAQVNQGLDDVDDIPF